MRKFVSAVFRDRDHYQVAAALAESGALDRLYTDYYARASGGSGFLSHRRSSAINADITRGSRLAVAAQVAYEGARRLRFPARFPNETVERSIASKVRKRIRLRPELDLFVYAGFARTTFRDFPDRRRFLFQYHPSPRHVLAALENDDLRTWREWQLEPEERSLEVERTYALEIAHSDRIFCASSFTARGLFNDGVERHSVVVSPYGCTTDELGADVTPPLLHGERATSPNFLFVGQGVRRKGLHLLLEAWNTRELKHAQLTIVAYRMDPAIAALATKCSNVHIKSELSNQQLRQLMADSDALILPSLVEGFGLVIGEALSHGCRVIASDHTGLPDYKVPKAVGTVVPAGRIETLRQAIIEFAETFSADRPYAASVYNVVQRNSWVRFRNVISDHLD